MAFERLNYFVIVTTDDARVFGYFASRELAEEVCRLSFGERGIVVDMTGMARMYHSIADWNRDALRRSALEKLTNEERVALGLAADPTRLKSPAEQVYESIFGGM